MQCSNQLRNVRTINAKLPYGNGKKVAINSLIWRIFITIWHFLLFHRVVDDKIVKRHKKFVNKRIQMLIFICKKFCRFDLSQPEYEFIIKIRRKKYLRFHNRKTLFQHTNRFSVHSQINYKLNLIFGISVLEYKKVDVIFVFTW